MRAPGMEDRIAPENGWSIWMRLGLGDSEPVARRVLGSVITRKKRRQEDDKSGCANHMRQDSLALVDWNTVPFVWDLMTSETDDKDRGAG